MSDRSENPLRAYFDRNPGRLISKWEHYFDIYHRHLERFRGRAITLVEIGVYHGGSLQMWRHYLGPMARIVGVDIEPRTAALATADTEIMIGDQADPAFLARLARQVGRIDVLIDDGGHTMQQQLQTFLALYPAVAHDGVFLVEDLHTSYWREYGGAYRGQFSFLELTKTLIDQLNAWHSRDAHSFVVDGYTQSTGSMHYYDSVLVIEKRRREPPRKCESGKPYFGGTEKGAV